MIHAPTIRAFRADEWHVYKDLRLRALADSPDAFGKILAEEEGRPDAEWSSRLASGLDSQSNLPLMAEIGGDPIGLAWGRIDASDPEAAARAQNASRLDLSVTCGDSSARRLYERLSGQPMRLAHLHPPGT